MTRRLALALVNWLIAHFDLSVIEESRRIGGKDAVERGARWESFYNEADGLRDMLEGLRREAFEAASEVPPEEVKKLQYWAMSDRNIRRLQRRVEQVIVTGKLTAERAEKADRMKSATIRR